MKTLIIQQKGSAWSHALARHVSVFAKKISVLKVLFVAPLLIERLRGAKTIIIGPSKLQAPLTLIAKILLFDVVWIGEGSHTKPKKKLYAQFSRLPRHIITPNQASEAHFLHSGIPGKKLTVLYPPSEHITTRVFIEPERLIIACDGSIAFEDGLGSLLRSVALARDIVGSISLVIGGDVQDIKRIGWIAKQLKLTDAIKLVPSNTLNWVAEANVYALPRATDTTPPLSLLAAMSIGHAIIATDQLSHREFIEQNKNGIVVEPNNAEMFSQAIINLARKPEWAQLLGTENTLFAQRHFSKDQLEQKRSLILP